MEGALFAFQVKAGVKDRRGGTANKFVVVAVTFASVDVVLAYPFIIWVLIPF